MRHIVFGAIVLLVLFQSMGCGGDTQIVYQPTPLPSEAVFGPARSTTPQATVTTTIELKAYQCFPSLPQTLFLTGTQVSLACNRIQFTTAAPLATGLGNTHVVNFDVGGANLYGTSGVNPAFAYLNPVVTVNGVQLSNDNIAGDNLAWQFDANGNPSVTMTDVVVRYTPAAPTSFELGGPVLYFSYDITAPFPTWWIVPPDPANPGSYAFTLRNVPEGAYESNIQLGHFSYAVSSGTTVGTLVIESGTVPGNITSTVLYVYPDPQQNPFGGTNLDVVQENLFFLVTTTGPQQLFCGAQICGIQLQ